MSKQASIDVEVPFYIADWRVDPETGRIVRKGVERKIEPKAMTVLICLVKQQGHVISRESLEQQAWKDVVVGYDSLAGAIIKLRKAFGDNSKNPQYIETVPKKGYRLICPVRSSAMANDDSVIQQAVSQKVELQKVESQEGEFLTVESQEAESQAAIHQTVHPPTKTSILNKISLRNKWIISFVFLLFVALLVVINTDVFRPVAKVQNSALPTIAVLPFKNISDDAQQDYFSDGITADLITDLSKVSGLFVIARHSVFIFKNTDITIRAVKDELGVDYVVEGSVRKVGDRLRISARLIDASNNINVWADRYDGSIKNIFAFQDKVTAQIISSLKIQLTDKDRHRLAGKYSDSIEAYDQFLRGWQSLWLSSREGMLKAREYFLKAIELDGQFARAYANLALTYVYDYLHGWANNDALALIKMHEYADKGIAIDSQLPQAFWVKGFADIFNRDYQQALEHAQRSIDLDPGFVDGYGLLATILNYAGKPKQADVVMRKAMKLNPKFPAIYHVIYGEILFNMHNYQRAIENFKTALDINPDIEESRIWLAAAYANSGDIEEASWQIEQLEISGRTLSLQRLEKVIPFNDPEQRQHFIDGLFKAGVM